MIELYKRNIYFFLLLKHFPCRNKINKILAKCEYSLKNCQAFHVYVTIHENHEDEMPRHSREPEMSGSN